MTKRRRSKSSLPGNHQLKKTLDQLYSQYLADFKKSPESFFQRRKDPILFPHRYSTFHDREAAAFLAATFAYGNVTSLCAFTERLLGLLQPSPYQFLKKGPEMIQSIAVHEPYYRLHKSREILALLSLLSLIYSRHGSLYELFLSVYYSDSTMKQNLNHFVARLRELSSTPLPFLLPSPDGGSPCKRLNLFLRWMVRRDGMDLGLWEHVSPSALVIPVDTHIGKTAFRLGWIQSPSITWQKAEAITEVLRTFDAEDPTRYDFSLCHESISKSKWLAFHLDD
jgi:uncharacterized protein (TIGR02757 family)